MIVTLWGTRGSLAGSGPEISKYGGNTSCVEVRGANEKHVLILDAGTGIRRLGDAVENKVNRVDILLTHLHLDHIQGLGFFSPLYDANMEVHIYGPATSNRHLHSQLTKYLSPPLFPVLLNDLPCKLYLHRLPDGEFEIGEFLITGDVVCHPGITYGYRILSKAGTMTYMPDHEPALGTTVFPLEAQWTSGYGLATGVDLLLHDAQYTQQEYQNRIGWGHSTMEQAIAFANLAKVKNLVTFHHDPSHTDEELDLILSSAKPLLDPRIKVLPGREGTVFKLPLK